MKRFFLFIVLLVSSMGCGSEETAPPAEAELPAIGLMEVPIALNNNAPEPSNALQLAITRDEINLGGQPAVTLERGRLSADAFNEEGVIGGLLTAIRNAPARRTVALRALAITPYQTFVRVLRTLRAADLREVHIAVRTPGERPGEGWMKLSNFDVIGASTEPEFAGRPRPWSAFTEHWREAYRSCRGGRYVNCDGTPTNIAEGGDLHVELWTRGQGMRATFRQANVEVEEETPVRRAGPALIEGVAAAPVEPEEQPQGEPRRAGAFTLRHQDATIEDSALSAIANPVCGAESCQTVVHTDPDTPMMRIVSLLGAFFPNGASQPELRFRLPE